MIIAVVNSKGGVGKSTLAGNLAGWLSCHGHKVTLVDCDSQQSSSQWIREAAPEVQVVRLESSDQVLDELIPLAREADYLIADGPGSQNELSRSLLLKADLAIIPAKASMFEARALDLNIHFVAQAREVRGGLPEAIVVLSMVGREYRLTKDMRVLAQRMNLTLARTQLTLRQAHADAPGQAKFVWNMSNSAKDAAREIDELCTELLPEAVGSIMLCKNQNLESDIQKELQQRRAKL